MPVVRARKVWPQGRVIRLDHQSEVLRGNPWNDPSARPLHIYLPAGYRDDADPYIALWDLAAFTNSGCGHLNWRNHGENLPERLDRLIGQGKMSTAVVVLPDCYTSLGGNQYVNSPALGNYADYLVKELVPFVSSQVIVIDHRDGRGLFGHSSGGFGALHHAMHFNETWGAAACHAGDVGFELVYRPAFAEVCSVLADYHGDHAVFIRAFWDKNKPASRDYSALMMLAMAASYDPDFENPGLLRLPFDLRTCTLNQERWSRWLACDPLNQVTTFAEALKALHGLYIDVGTRDQYHIQFGSRVLADQLRQLEIDFHYEEFDGDHSAMDWRLDYSLPYLAAALKKAIGAAT